MRRPFGRRAAIHLSLLALVGATLVATAERQPTPAQAAPALAAPAPVSNGIEYKVLVFTRSATGGDPAATAAGVQAIQQLGRERRFTVEVTDDARKFDDPHLKQFRAVVFLNTAGDVLTDTQQAAFEQYYRDGGGFVGVHSAIEAEPGWSFLTNVLGTRATGTASAVSKATVNVADRVHPAVRDAARSAGPAPTAGTTSRPTSGASRTCWPRWTRRPTPAAPWATTTR